eukprot:TRINITY_DN2609_c0_g1_i1.p1 TRINITY_DN2609_c0_g1~~TRINITY_DN2609_c0_g1_i1.p1  ORF type:complete len:170 (-),score=37.73 TRINITY_DN2609_c0_g1_i1:241-693(-)
MAVQRSVRLSSTGKNPASRVRIALALDGGRRRQIIFDNRYGWIYDVWVPPSDVAHCGGRNFFALSSAVRRAAAASVSLADRASDRIVKAVVALQQGRGFPLTWPQQQQLPLPLPPLKQIISSISQSLRACSHWKAREMTLLQVRKKLAKD